MIARPARAAVVVLVLALALASPAGALARDGRVVGGAVPASVEHFVARLLRDAVLPRGALAYSGRLPATLEHPAESLGVAHLLDRDRVSLAPGGLARVVGELRHLLGARVTTSGSGGGPAGCCTFSFLGTTVHPTPRDVAQVELDYELVADGDGSTLVRVDVLAAWVPPRPRDEHVDAVRGATVTTYRWASLEGSTDPIVSRLSAPAAMRLVAALNALPLSDGSVCMETTLEYTIAFTPAAAGSPVARVRGEACDHSVDLELGAAREPPLADGADAFGRVLAAVLPPGNAGALARDLHPAGGPGSRQ